MSLNCNASHKPLTYLCDSQADISIIKISAIEKQLFTDKSHTIDIKGVTKDIIESLGIVNLEFYFDSITIVYTFHIVPDEFNIPADGIIGRDFNKYFNCKIDYADMTFTIRYSETNIIIPIISEPSANTLALPARCETFRIFHLQNYSEPMVIPAQEISDGIFVPNTIVYSKDPVIRVLNTNDSMKLVKNNITNVFKITDFDIFKPTQSKAEHSQERIKILATYFYKTPQYIKNDLFDLCSEFVDIFALPNDTMTVNNFYEQKLRTKTDQPVYVKNYRLPQSQKEEINNQVAKLLSNNLIEPSVSSFNSPLILVPKKSNNGQRKWRMCVDYRLLNKNLVADKFPLPRIDDILDNLGKAKHFSVLDLYSGFHQIPLSKESREMTAFSTEKGSFQWKVLPFGLNVAPNSFSRMMQLAFSGIPPQAMFIYMDDIIVIGTSIKNHLDNLRMVFTTCRKCNLKINPEKCEFFRPEVHFLGHVCTEFGIKPDSKKLEAIDKYPKPIDKESTRRFTAFANYYRRFIPNFAEITRPLNIIQKKSEPFIWSSECNKSFEKLKILLKSPPVLAYPDWSKEFIVTVDSSIFACGGVLSQLIDGHDKPISYISKTYKKGELNKPIIEKELLAIHFAITTLRPYLYGTKFTVRSDHRPLVYLYNMKDPSSKLTRIRLDLEEYNFEIIHIKGKDNVVADALSRISIDDLKSVFDDNNTVLVMTRAQSKRAQTDNNKNTTSKNEKIERPKIYEEISRQFDRKTPRIKCTLENSKLNLRAYQNHKPIIEFVVSSTTEPNKFSLVTILRKIEKEASACKIYKLQLPKDDLFFRIFNLNELKIKGEIILKNLQLIVVNPAVKINENEKKLELMKKYHDDPIFGGHMGRKKMYTKLRSLFYWKGMINDINKFINDCPKCAVNKPRNGVRMPMMITKTPQRPFDTIIIDTIGKLPRSPNGNEYAVTLVCDLTKYLVTSPIPDKSANTIAKAIVKDLVLIYGPPKEMRSDRGTEYCNQIMTETCNILNIKHCTSTAYRHESVGSIERNHRFFNQYIRSYVNEISEWEEYLRYFTFCYNISTHSSFNDKYSPFELVFSRKIDLPHNLVNNTVEPIYNIDNFAKEAKYRMQMSNKIARKILIKSKERNKLQYDKLTKNVELKVGDSVYLKNLPYDKFKQVYLGPFTVKSIREPNIEIFDSKTNKTTLVHMNRLGK